MLEGEGGIKQGFLEIKPLSTEVDGMRGEGFQATHVGDNNTYSCNTQSSWNGTYFQISQALHCWRLCPAAGSLPAPPLLPAASAQSSDQEILLLQLPGSLPQPGTLLWVAPQWWTHCLFSLVLLLPEGINIWHQPLEALQIKACYQKERLLENKL